MDQKEICKKIKNITKKLLLLDGDRVVSTGTGVFIDKEGTIITANHVIAAYSKLKNPRILANLINEKGAIEQILYEQFASNIILDVHPGVIKPLNIDLAILKPVSNISGVEFIEMESALAEVGSNVFMAGFPDEIKLIFDLQDQMDYRNNDELADNEEEIQQHLENSMSLLMIKSGMIGAAHKASVTVSFNGKSVAFEGSSYWIDNGCTFGASGGPVVNEEGRLIGIMCQKGSTTSFDRKGLDPSGSTMALSHHFITWTQNV